MHRHERKRDAQSVPPLEVSVERDVRLEEVDPLAIMWHGRYASWLEDGRECFGRTYGISYLRFQSEGILVPIKLLHLDFKRPLTYPGRYTVWTKLLWNPAAVLDFTYTIRDATGATMTLASTTQLMVTSEGTLVLEPPSFYLSFCEKWAKGDFS
ncbi:MAG: acyl-CoA thioesterase [Desulfovibrionaceae bacterium]|nr:acyl-CoA thioesterase [Desulfovibrionaceae bacterium]